jgi:hypothetical protein
MTLSIKALTFDTGGKILDRGLSAAPAAAAGAGRLAAGTGTAPGPVDQQRNESQSQQRRSHVTAMMKGTVRTCPLAMNCSHNR